MPVWLACFIHRLACSPSSAMVATVGLNKYRDIHVRKEVGLESLNNTGSSKERHFERVGDKSSLQGRGPGAVPARVTPGNNVPSHVGSSNQAPGRSSRREQVSAYTLATSFAVRTLDVSSLHASLSSDTHKGALRSQRPHWRDISGTTEPVERSQRSTFIGPPRSTPAKHHSLASLDPAPPKRHEHAALPLPPTRRPSHDPDRPWPP